MAALNVLRHTARELAADRPIALCAIVATRGSTPQPAGVIACVDAAGRMTGTLGGGCAEAEIRTQAFQRLCQETKTPAAPHAERDQPSPGSVHSIVLDHDATDGDGLICGGRLDVLIQILHPAVHAAAYVELAERYAAGASVTLHLLAASSPSGRPPRPPPAAPIEYRVRMDPIPHLWIAGAGHIGRILARFAITLEFRVTVVDDRADFANPDRFPPPIEIVVGDISRTLAAAPMDQNTYVTIVTRGHKHDRDALAVVLARPLRYLGMIGSRRKIRTIFDELRHAGASEESLARVHAPIGLPIDAVTTEEIALSIAAQLVAVRRADARPTVEAPFPAESHVAT